MARVTIADPLWYARPGMNSAPRPTPSSFQPAGAGGLLLAVDALALGAGALVGWAAGSIGLGILGGAVAGIPIGVFAVYRRYRGTFS